MAENFIKNGKLIPEKEWHSHIAKLEDEVKELIKQNKEEKLSEVKLYKKLKDKLKDAIIEAIKKRIPEQPFAVFFSGGVDSTFISMMLKKLGAKFTCYTVGFMAEKGELPQDIVYARTIGDELKLMVVTKLFNLDEAEKIIKKTVSTLPKCEGIQLVVNAGVGSVIAAASSIAKEKIFFSGIGSEEIFAGYERHMKAKDANKECWNGLKNMWKRDLERDYTIGKEIGIDIRTPLMDEDVIKIAMQIDASKKINKSHKKIVFREIAEDLGLKKEFAWRKKVGAQYGSKFDRAIEKLAKKNRFKTKGDYLESLK